MAEPIEMLCELMATPIVMLFGLWTQVGPGKHVHWSHLANTTEPSMCGGNVAFLSNYFGHILWLSLLLLSLCTIKFKFPKIGKTL